MENIINHQYIDRKTGKVKTERLFKDSIINFFYSTVRENADFCFNLIVSGRSTSLLSYLNFDFAFRSNREKAQKFINELNINLEECILSPEKFMTARQVFERQIQYWKYRPMPNDKNINYDEINGYLFINSDLYQSQNQSNTIVDDGIVVSPSDSKVLVGSLRKSQQFFIKEKFFQYSELLEKEELLKIFQNGDFAIFRLTPDEYHYNHTPVSGKVVDFYEIRGQFHSCNPYAVVQEVTPYSKNDRVVTVIDTDVDGGTQIGMVAMVEVTAMMIGRVEQCYSHNYYESPRKMTPEMYLRKGQPKSLFRPGSSTVILLFEEGKIKFSDDIVKNMSRTDADSRFTIGFGSPLVETSVRVREEIGIGSNIF
ncbi:MAG: phosphatidylserine decarboxylase [Desulfamplus sp.]|nr:phosphatidylserine decarboxylase [Desulfamplus sp.]